MTKRELAQELAFARQALAAKRIRKGLDEGPACNEQVVITHAHDCRYCETSWYCHEDCGQRPGLVTKHGCPEQQEHAAKIAAMLSRQARNVDSPYVSRHLDSNGKPVKTGESQSSLKQELASLQAELKRVRAELSAKA